MDSATADMSNGESSEDEVDENDDEAVGQVSEDEEGQVVHNTGVVEVQEDFSIDIEPIETGAVNEEQSHEVSCVWSGFKIVSDNIDKNIWPSFQWINHQTVSLHYFHSCAVGDRINFASLSDIAPYHVSLDPTFILPSATDLDAIKKEFQVHVSRYINKCT